MILEALIARFGLLAIGVGAAIEGEAVVLTGGLLAHQELLPLGGVIAAAALGSFIADEIFFFLGRRFGAHPRIRRITERPAFARVLAMLERHPVAFVFAFRFLYGLRTISPIAIGTTTIPASRFVLLNGAAAIVWSIAITGLGYGFGHTVERAFGQLHRIEHVALAIGALILVTVAAALLVRRSVKIHIVDEHA
ncbi:MAG: DedA family protein [Sphingomonadales bacterium]|nr:MAG: DedA family protein [Sphingomonadales bacterium]